MSSFSERGDLTQNSDHSEDDLDETELEDMDVALGRTLKSSVNAYLKETSLHGWKYVR